MLPYPQDAYILHPQEFTVPIQALSHPVHELQPHTPMHTLCSCSSSSLLSHVKARRLAFYMRPYTYLSSTLHDLASVWRSTLPSLFFPFFLTFPFFPGCRRCRCRRRRPINKTRSLRNARAHFHPPLHPAPLTGRLLLATAPRKRRFSIRVITHALSSYAPLAPARSVIVAYDKRNTTGSVVLFLSATRQRDSSIGRMYALPLAEGLRHSSLSLSLSR